MKKKVKITSNNEEKSIIKNAIESSENEQLDLYQAIFGGKNNSTCSVLTTAIEGEMQSSAFDKYDSFLKAAL